MTLECKNFKPFKKGYLLGFADIFVPKWGCTIFGITLYEKEGKRWINLPSREYEKDGKKVHLPFIRFEEVNHYNLFCSMVKDAIDKKVNDDTKETTHESTADSEVYF